MRKSVCIVMLMLLIVSTAEAGERLRMAFIGDVMAHDRQLEAARRGDAYDFSPQFARIARLFDGSLVVANFETVMAGSKGRGYTGYPTFNTPDSLADALVSAGVDVVTVANNHILDRGESGLLRTLDVLDASGLRWVGATRGESTLCEPIVVERDGVRVAIVNFTYGTNVPPRSPKTASVPVISRDAVARSMARARALSPDITVACLHWGIEYVYEPRKSDRDIAALCAAEGADLVIGTHPHVLQPIEVVEAGGRPRLMAWSLGNFVSFQRTLPRERSVVLAVDFERAADGTMRMVGTSAAPTWVSARHEGGRRRIEVVYAGEGGGFNHAGLPASEVKRARAAGRRVIDFLGTIGEADERGFYRLWSADAPHVTPKPRIASPE